MKGIKISKTGWIILSAGIFIVVLAGLGITRSGQVKQQSKLGTDLTSSQLRLDKLDTSGYQMQLDELEQQLADSDQQLAQVKDKLRQKIESVDVTDKFYEIAAFYSVNVTILGTTKLVKDSYQGVPCSVISLTATARGDFPDIVDFIAGLNNNYRTGFVQSTEIQAPTVATDNTSDANINLIVYSYEGS
jgi:hypothetical protein